MVGSVEDKIRYAIGPGAQGGLRQRKAQNGERSVQGTPEPCERPGVVGSVEDKIRLGTSQSGIKCLEYNKATQAKRAHHRNQCKRISWRGTPHSFGEGKILASWENLLYKKIW